MKKTILLIIVLILGVLTFSQGLYSWEHNINPALINTRRRSIFELNVTPDINIYQNLVKNSFIFDNLNKKEITIDLNDFYEGLNGNDFELSTDDYINTNFAINIFDLGLSVYANATVEAEAKVPNELLKLIVEGNEINKTYKGKGDLNSFSTAEVGAYLSYKYSDNLLGIKYGWFVPVLVSDKNSGYDYEFVTSNQTSSINANLNVEAPFYSVFNSSEIENLNVNTVFDRINSNRGQSIDIGYIRYADEEPWFGISVGNITLSPALANKGIKAVGNYTIDSTNLIFENKFEVKGDIKLEDIQNVNEKISKPLKLTGFYKQNLLIDWIPYIEYYPTLSRIDWGVFARGDLFVIPYSIGFENINKLWKVSIGTGINLHILELDLSVASVSTDITKILDLRGISAKVNLSLGF
ncbi:hypothetical protein OF820_05345 [Oceanotoga sp. DSM 15011]|uniref:hypothetical protein n=1 Tax=Oceanotoga sp. DSM 15011 TaxID=2984951 RepID=UPI0021F430E7|nr:hypothetical protein [Oceanotoga sp. DSM 15011]UYP01109.1 hypothetical protein OF820_05345 [Oceanotoga sp. DSM 15011]